jgi:hypothetical protein
MTSNLEVPAEQRKLLDDELHNLDFSSNMLIVIKSSRLAYKTWKIMMIDTDVRII